MQVENRRKQGTIDLAGCGPRHTDGRQLRSVRCGVLLARRKGPKLRHPLLKHGPRRMTPSVRHAGHGRCHFCHFFFCPLEEGEDLLNRLIGASAADRAGICRYASALRVAPAPCGPPTTVEGRSSRPAASSTRLPSAFTKLIPCQLIDAHIFPPSTPTFPSQLPSPAIPRPLALLLHPPSQLPACTPPPPPPSRYPGTRVQPLRHLSPASPSLSSHSRTLHPATFRSSISPTSRRPTASSPRAPAPCHHRLQSRPGYSPLYCMGRC